jgi:hypothetical protein
VEGGEGGYPVRVQVMKLPINLMGLGDTFPGIGYQADGENLIVFCLH